MGGSFPEVGMSFVTNQKMGQPCLVFMGMGGMGTGGVDGV